jgi:type I restriction enzyme S subunit
LRFPEFNDEWITVKLNDISEEIKRKKDSITKEDNILTISSKVGFIDQKDRFNQIIAGNSLKKYTYLKKDEFSYNRGNSKTYPYGCIYRLDYKSALVPNVYRSFRIKSGVPLFFEEFFKTKKIDRQLRKIITSTARMDGLLNISAKDFFNVTITISPIEKEQEKIASFLNNIDKKLKLLKNKKEGFIEFKHYLLQNLFPQNGETVPKLRFNKNVTYEKCQVSDFLRVSELDAVDDINRRLTVKLNLKGIYKREVKPNEKEGATKQYERKAGQFIYGKQNLFKGAFGIIPFELDGFLSSKDLPSFDFNNNIIPQWFYYYFSREDFYKHLENLSNGTGSKRISPEEFLKILINVPQDKEEQEKIASTLSTIDNKIDLIEKEIELVEEYKKGLLQKMFI